MRTTSLAASLFCLAAAHGTLAAQKEADAIVEPSTKVPRGKLLEWKSDQGKTYWYRLPKDIDAKSPPDLLLMLHGSGGSHGWSFWNYPILGDFRRRDIVVSPGALTPGQGDSFNFMQNQKDGDQIVGLIADFKKRFPIGRVYLYGHSQGAFFCYWFAGEHPELVDGIVAHAGNVLDVKHSKLAKQRVAIGILHGRADAVVPVDCAVRTEQIYREQGYEKLKLEIVDGLNAKTGHWPLPIQVGKMLDWLDQVSTQSARQAMRILASELRQQAPDLAIVTEQAEKVKKLLPKGDDIDKRELPPQLASLQQWLDQVRDAHAERLLQDGQVTDPKAAFGVWVPHFQRLDAAFHDDPQWRKQLQKAREVAARHDKLVDKALKNLDKAGKDSLSTAVKAYEAAFLAADAEQLRSRLAIVFRDASPPDVAGQQQFEGLVASRAEAEAEADKAYAELMAPLLVELKEQLPALFAAEPEHPAK